VPRYRAAILAFSLFSIPLAQAQEASLCQTVAHHLWSEVATGELRQQTPLAELIAAAPAAFRPGGTTGLAKPDQAIADALVQDHAADPPLADKLHDLPPSDAVRFGATDVWLLDRVDGTLGCHTTTTVLVPPGGPAHELGLPGNPDPTTLCALSALTAVSIDGVPALWIEQSGAFSNSVAQSTIAIAGLRGGTFTPPCTVALDYVVTDRATHALCDGVDCVPLIQMAEILAMRLRQGETADSLGGGIIQTEEDGSDYRQMAEIVSADKQPAELPTFGVSLDTPYVAFSDQVTFPVRSADGHVYLARLGHGGFGWRQTADTLLALYRLRSGQLVPAAGIYIAARRTGVSSVTIQ
jgi:hypothetical protein